MGILKAFDQKVDQLSQSINDGIDSFIDKSNNNTDAIIPKSEDIEATDTCESVPQEEKTDANDEYYKHFRTEGLVYDIEGNRGRHLFVYDDRCMIIVKPTVGSVITGNATDGEKTIFYKDCIGIQFKESHLAIGYIQIETASAIGNNGKNNFFNENTFTFEDSKGIATTVNGNVYEVAQKYTNMVNSVIKTNKTTTNEFMREVANYIIGKVSQYKKVDYSVADEIKKFKALLDSNAITQEEYDEKKRQLLSL